jgi:hypothetical protein
MWNENISFDKILKQKCQTTRLHQIVFGNFIPQQDYFLASGDDGCFDYVIVIYITICVSELFLARR